MSVNRPCNNDFCQNLDFHYLLLLDHYRKYFRWKLFDDRMKMISCYVRLFGDVLRGSRIQLETVPVWKELVTTSKLRKFYQVICTNQAVQRFFSIHVRRWRCRPSITVRTSWCLNYSTLQIMNNINYLTQTRTPLINSSNGANNEKWLHVSTLSPPTQRCLKFSTKYPLLS